MSKLKLIAAIALVTAAAACQQPGYNNGYGQKKPAINANCTALGAVGGAALGAATDNNIAQTAFVGGVAGARAGTAGYRG